MVAQAPGSTSINYSRQCACNFVWANAENNFTIWERYGGRGGVRKLQSIPVCFGTVQTRSLRALENSKEYPAE